MPSLLRIVLLALPLALPVLTLTPSPTPTTDQYSNNQAFQDLLNALPEESLHAALHGELPKFQDGVFESGHHGVERMHDENPALATKLIIAAVEELKKRQAPQPTNGTSPTSQVGGNSQAPSSQAPSSQAPPASSAPASNPPPASSPAQSAVVVPVPITTTNAQGKATVVSSAILSNPTAFISVQVTRTNAQGATVVTQETKPGVVLSATNAAGSVFLTTSAVEYQPTPGQVLTTTDSKGSTFLTTYTPGGGKVSSILLITTTGSDGKPSVVTSYAFVGGQQTGNGATGGGSPTNTAKPGLQSGAAAPVARLWGMDAALIGGAVGAALLI